MYLYRKMNDHFIIDYTVRSSYSNFRTIKFFVEECVPENHSLYSNYLQPEIEYLEKNHSRTQVFCGHFFDIPFLCQENKEKGKEYLRHLILADEGNGESKNLVDELISRYKAEKQEQINRITLVEDPFVVPSSTDLGYSDEQISQKGAILLNLSQKLFPVPDFCVFTANTFFSTSHQKETSLRHAIENLEKMTGLKFGDATNPLVFAMRSATSFYIPGFLPTYLNAGINETVYQALKMKYGAVVAGKIYLNNLQSIHKILFPNHSRGDLCKPVGPDCTLKEIENGIDLLVEEVGKVNAAILSDPFSQVLFFVESMHEFFRCNQDLAYTFKRGNISYPSIILQKMVWTVRNDSSYPGVLYSRHSRTGIGIQIESAVNIFGDDIMTGSMERTDTEFFEREEIMNTFPAVYHFVPSLSKLETLFESPVTIEFAAEFRKNAYLFAVLQLNTSELTGRSTLLSAIDMFKKRMISAERVIQLIQPYHLRQIFSERIDDKSFQELAYFCKGISVLPRSAVTARIFFSTAMALEAKKNGEKVCLCKETFVPADTIILCELDAIISLTPAAVHVVTSCLGYGIPAFLNLYKYQVKLLDQALENSDGVVLREGDWITMSSKKRMILTGKANFEPARFQKYLEGEILDMQLKEERVFINMKAAYDEYQDIIRNLDYYHVNTLNDLIRVIRNDLQTKPDKAKKLVNSWLHSNLTPYIEQILKSEMGTHRDQQMIYDLFTLDDKIIFFKKAIALCNQRHIRGFDAGSFMLGRFICLIHPVAFWERMNAGEIAFLLNEYILFEKYIQVLNDLGERHINRVRRKILDDGISSVNLSHIDPTVFITLKLIFKEWDLLKKDHSEELDPETLYLIDLLKRPFGYFFDYKAPWSLHRLTKICEQEKMAVPDEAAS
ncbi:MAG TPA: hypothetical protein PKH94_04285 [Bacteroidales bacterium]|nr:hypothetical protein [Bacteroidales bacterium]HNS46435.1 hypothetical protein [Bacteroidales bacterium]